MANLARPAGERAQVLLVTALVLGVSFVALALLLNSAIFTENLASRGETTGAGAVVGYHGDLERGVGAVVAAENRNASTSDDHATVLDRVEVGVAEMRRIIGTRHAKRGVVSDARIVGHGDGARIFQSDETRNFSDGTGDANWTVAADVTGTRAFELAVDRTAVPDCSSATACFNVSITDGTDAWNVSIEDGPSGLEVVVDDDTTTESCDPVTQSVVTIDLTAGTVAGENCPALAFADAPNGPYDVRFSEADEVAGTYSLVVDDPTAATSPQPHFGASPNPTVTPAVYDLTVSYEYETSAVFVANEVRVAPGEADGR